MIATIYSLFASCATVLNEPWIEVKVRSSIDSLKICVNNDTAKWYEVPVKLKVDRSKQDLLITTKKDSVANQIPVESKYDFKYMYGNIETFGIGYIIDRKSLKKYTYPKSVFIGMEDGRFVSQSGYRRWKKQPERHLLNLKISIPEANHFYMDKGDRYGESFGYLGISGGFEYYFSNKYCINMDVGSLMDFIFPIPAPYDVIGAYNRSFATYGDLQIGSDYRRLHYDIGLQFTKTLYVERETVELFPEYFDTLKYSKYQKNIGMALSAYFRLTKFFNLGLNYYPSFFVLEKTGIKSHYSHLLFFELSFRIEAFRPKNRKN
jgi:hypothetical protein